MAVGPGYRLAAVSGGAPGDLDAVLSEAARALQIGGLRVAGAIQTNTERPGRRCDMVLTVLPDGGSFQDFRGSWPLVRGLPIGCGRVVERRARLGANNGGVVRRDDP
ncbi:MAG: DUF2478 domain-containing protein [Dinoroseobacter sp.]|nr:DUF2478 domain-containing protein [Dinoroseobacter sp.]